MDKLDMSFELSEQQKQAKEKTYQILIKNKHIKAWLKKYGQSEAFVYDHTGKFSDWLEDIQKCDGCAGINFCAQKIKGQYMDLYLDGFLNFGIHRCEYYKEYESALSHGAFYLDNKLGEDQLRIDLSTIDLSKEKKEYKLNIVHIVDVIENEASQKGLYLWGKPGVGKSYLATGITNFYTKKKTRCAFVNVPKLISDLKMMFHDQDASLQKLKTLRNVPVLVLDDIGGESVTAWSRDDILLPLLDTRMEHHRLTFFTSNYNLQELKERYVMTSNKVSEPMAAERLLERIQTLAHEEFVKGESRRK